MLQKTDKHAEPVNTVVTETPSEFKPLKLAESSITTTTNQQNGEGGIVDVPHRNVPPPPVRQMSLRLPNISVNSDHEQEGISNVPNQCLPTTETRKTPPTQDTIDNRSKLREPPNSHALPPRTPERSLVPQPTPTCQQPTSIQR